MAVSVLVLVLVLGPRPARVSVHKQFVQWTFWALLGAILLCSDKRCQLRNVLGDCGECTDFQSDSGRGQCRVDCEMCSILLCHCTPGQEWGPGNKLSQPSGLSRGNIEITLKLLHNEAVNKFIKATTT